MDRTINRTSHLTIFGILILLTAAAPTPAKSKSTGNLMLDYNWPVPDPNVNRIPHEKSCHHYYLVLSEEDISVEKCPDGRIFDYVVHTCSPKEIARCWSHHFGKILHSHPMRKHFRCPYAWGKYPDIHDCQKYYSCISGKPKHKKCAPYEKFDKVLGKCVGEIYAVCADISDVIEHGYECPKAWGSFVSSKNCSKYYECLEKKPTLRTCPKDTLFHEHKRRCVPKDHVKCGSRRNPYENTAVTSFQPKTSTLNPIDTSTSKLDIEDANTSVPPGSTNKQSEQQSTTEIIGELKNRQEIVSDSEIHSASTEESKVPVDDSTRIKSHDNLETNAGGNSEVQETSTRSEIPAQKLTFSNYIFDHQNNRNSEVQETSTIKVTEQKDERNTKLLTDSGIKNDLGKFTTSDGTVKINSKMNENIKPKMGVSASINEFVEVSTSSKSQSKDSSDITRNTDGHVTEVPTGVISKHTETVTDSSSKTQDVTSQDSTSLSSNTGGVTEKKCPPGDETCSIDKTGGVIRCPSASGSYPHPRDESRYLQCQNYKIQVLTCPPGHIYNTHERKCDSAVILFR